MPSKKWANKDMRTQNIKKLRAALQNCGKAETESVEDIEQQLMDKSRTMEEYLQNVAKVLVHCSNKMQNRQLAGQVQHNPNMLHGPGMHVASQGMPMQPGGPMHAPPPGQPGMQPMHPNQMNPNMQMNQVDPAMMQGMPPGNVQIGMMQRRQAMYGGPNINPVSPHVQPGPPHQPDEDALYAIKLAELQKKFRVPLQKLKERNAQKKSAGSGGELKKIDEVLDILMSSRKIKLEALVNIESVLFKLFKGSSAITDPGSVEKGPMSAEKAALSRSANSSTSLGAVSSSGAPTSGVRNTHFCQPLIDGVANHACSSSFFHTVRRTFGSGLYSLHGDVTQYPPAKRPKKGEPTTLEILDSEIERLPSFFKVDVKNRSRGDVEVDVKHMKHSIVPCLTVIIPKKYPEQSPWVKGTRNKIGQQVERELENKLLAMSMNCTLTQILLYWELCIKKVLKSKISSRSHKLTTQRMVAYMLQS